MPNQLVSYFRQQYPNDPSTDGQILEIYADHYGPQVFQQFPDAAQDYAAYQQSQRVQNTDLSEQFGQGLVSGTKALGATLAGAGALGANLVGATGVAKSLGQTAQELNASAAQQPPSVPTIRDINGPVSALQWLARKSGEFVPNVGEAAAVSGIGALAGGAVEPAGGEVAGGLAGLLAKQSVKNVLGQLLEKEGLTGLEGAAATEAKQLLPKVLSGELAVDALPPKLLGVVEQGAQSLAQTYGANAAQFANFYSQGAGGIWNTLQQNPDVTPEDAEKAALTGGIGSGLAGLQFGSILGSVAGAKEAGSVVKSLLPGFLTSVPTDYIGRLWREAVKEGVTGASGMTLMELSNIAAEKWADPKTRGQGLNQQDINRLIESTVVGGLAGSVAAIPAAFHKPPAKTEQVEQPLTLQNVPHGTETPTEPVQTPVPVPEQATPQPQNVTPTSQPLTLTEEKPPPIIGDFMGRPVRFGQYVGTLLPRDDGGLQISTRDGRYVDIPESKVPPATPISQFGIEPLPRGAHNPAAHAAADLATIKDIFGGTDQSAAAILDRYNKAGTDGHSTGPLEKIYQALPADKKDKLDKWLFDRTADAAATRLKYAPEEQPAAEAESLAAQPDTQYAEILSSLHPAVNAVDNALDTLDGVKEDPTARASIRKLLTDPVLDTARKSAESVIEQFEKAGYGRETTDPLHSFIDRVSSYQERRGAPTPVEPANESGTLAQGSGDKNLGKRPEKAERAATAEGAVQSVGPTVAKSATVEANRTEPTPATIEARKVIEAAPPGAKAEEVRGEAQKAAEEAPKSILSIVPREDELTGEPIQRLPWNKLDEQRREAAAELEAARKARSGSDEFRKGEEKPPGPKAEQIGLFGEPKPPVPSEDMPGNEPEAQEPTDPNAPFRRPGEQSQRDQTSGRPSPPEQAANFFGALQAMANQGVDVSVLQPHIQTITKGLTGNLPGEGLFDHARRAVALVVNDISSPNRESIIGALHELGHVYFLKETPEMREAIHAAIDRLDDETLHIAASADPRNRMNNPYGLSADALMEERLAESIAQQLANKKIARGIAAKLWRGLKEVYFKAAMAVQEAFYGKGKANPKLAIEYVKNRIEAMVAGDPSPKDFISFVGGQKPDRLGETRFYRPTTGRAVLPERYDYATQTFSYPHQVPFTADAVLFNMRGPDVRYRKLEGPLALGQRQYGGESAVTVAGQDITTQNEFQDVVDRMFEKVKGASLNPNNFTVQQFMTDVLNYAGDLPEVIKQKAQGALVALGKAAPDDLRLEATRKHPNTPDSETVRKQAALNASILVRDLATHLNQQFSDATRKTDELRGLQPKIDQAANQVTRWNDRFEDADFVKHETMVAIRDELADVRKGIDQMSNAAWKGGILEQSLKQLNLWGDKGELGKSWEIALNRAFDSIQKSPDAFVDTLMAAARTIGDWEGSSLAEIKSALQTAASSEPFLSRLIDGTPESKLLLAITASFAKQHEQEMNLLSVRGTSDTTALLAFKQVLESGQKDTSAGLNRARAMAVKLPSLSDKAQRALGYLRESKKKVADLKSELDEATHFVAIHNAAYPTLRLEEQRLTSYYGARYIPFEPYDGAEFFHAPSPDASIDEVEKTKRNWGLKDGEAVPAADIAGIVQQNRAWMLANPEPGAVFNYLKDLNEKLVTQPISQAHGSIQNNFLNDLISSEGKKVANTGTNGGAAINRQTIKMEFNRSLEQRAGELGIKAMDALSDAMKKIGFKSPETFNDTFWQAGSKILENRKDLLGKTDEQKLAALKAEFMKNPDLRDRISRPGAWDSIGKFFKSSWDANDYLVEAGRTMGNTVNDPFLRMGRNAVGERGSTVARGTSQRLESLFNKMQGLWGPARPDLNPKDMAAKYNKDPDTFRAQIATLFTPDVLRGFVKPLVDFPDRSVFSGAQRRDGQFPLADRGDVQKAFSSAGGDVVKFAETLHALTGGTGDRGAFVADTLDTFANYYDAIAKQFGDKDRSDKAGLPTLPHQIMDARIAESFPGEWLRYETPDQNHNRTAVGYMAAANAYGRDASTLWRNFNTAKEELKLQAQRYQDVKSQMRAANLGASEKEIERLTDQSILKTENREALNRMKAAPKNLRAVEKSRRAMLTLLTAPGAGIKPLKGLMEVLHLMRSAALQGPKSALIMLNSMFDPLVTFGPSRTALKQIGVNWSTFGKEALGTFAQVFGHQIQWSADRASLRLDMGHYDLDAQTTMRQRLGAINVTDRGITKYARMAQTILGGTGIAPGKLTGKNRYDTLKLTAPFTQSVGWMEGAATEGVMSTFDDIARRASEYFKVNPVDAANPNFRFTADNLGYKNGIILNDERAFNYIRSRIENYGMNLENQARDIVERYNASGGNDTELYSPDQYRAIASLAANEVLLDSSPANSPAAWYTNPVLRMSLPLLAWSLRKTDQLHSAFKGPNGEVNWAAARNGLKVLTAVLPVGIAYSWMADEYDQHLTGKKSNIQTLGGPDLTSNLQALIEMVARQGTYGLAGDLADSVSSYATGGDLRGLSLDSRVLWANSTMGVLEALGNVLHQQTLDYPSFYRPLIGAVGGSGYLQFAQIANNALGLDNAESRMAGRISVQNYLRAAGRELGLDVRTGGAGQVASIPSPLHPFISQMSLAALANNSSDFQEAFGKAVQAAKDMGKPDAVDAVKRAFSATNPVRYVFQTQPSTAEIKDLLSVMPARGAEDAQSALGYWNRYAEMIGVAPYEGVSNKRAQSAQINAPVPSLSEVRARALNSGRSLATAGLGF